MIYITDKNYREITHILRFSLFVSLHSNVWRVSVVILSTFVLSLSFNKISTFLLSKEKKVAYNMQTNEMEMAVTKTHRIQKIIQINSLNQFINVISNQQ